jgi:hypothetical protein
VQRRINTGDLNDHRKFDSHTLPPYLISSHTLDLCAREHEGTLPTLHVPVGSKSRTSLLFAFRRRSGTALV